MIITNKIKKIVMSLVCICVSLLVTSAIYAEDNGGVVQTEGVVSFYEETTTSSSKPKVKPKDPKVIPKEPGKRLPQTGSQISLTGIFLGIFLILGGVILIVRKRDWEVGE